MNQGEEREATGFRFHEEKINLSLDDFLRSPDMEDQSGRDKNLWVVILIRRLMEWLVILQVFTH